MKQTTKDLQDGTYSILFTPTLLGKCYVEISINKAAIPTSPHTILVGPGPTSPGHTLVNLDELRVAFAGSDSHFTIIPRDEFHNVQPWIEGT